MPDQVRVYVSHHHSARDNEITRRLVSDLKAAGADVWVDYERITSSTLDYRIDENLVGRQWLVLVTTPEAMESLLVQREITAALHEVHAGHMRGIVALMVTPCDIADIPLQLRNLRILDATKDYEGARRLLFQELGLSASSPIMSLDSPPVSAVEAEAPEWPSLPSLDIPISQPPASTKKADTDTIIWDDTDNLPGGGHESPPDPAVEAETLSRTHEIEEALSGVLEIIRTSEDVEHDYGSWLPGPELGEDEHVSFTSHYPREVAPQVWDRMLVFIALDTAEAAAEVEAVVAGRLQQRRDEFRTATANDATIKLQRRTRLTIVPSLPGFHFDPASITTLWIDDVQCYEFRLRVDGAAPGRGVNGHIAILEGPLLRGEIPLSVFVRDVRQAPLGSGHFIDTRVAAYRNTFPSYSRKDEPIVRACHVVGTNVFSPLRFCVTLPLRRDATRRYQQRARRWSPADPLPLDPTERVEFSSDSAISHPELLEENP